MWRLPDRRSGWKADGRGVAEGGAADGGPFTVNAAYLAWRQSGDKRLVQPPVLDKLVKVFDAIPSASDGSGLVWIDPKSACERCPYGFTDTVRKQGKCLFTSLLKHEAGRRLEQMLRAAGRWTASTPRTSPGMSRTDRSDFQQLLAEGDGDGLGAVCLALRASSKSKRGTFLTHPLLDLPKLRVQNVVDRAVSCSTAPLKPTAPPRARVGRAVLSPASVPTSAGNDSRALRWLFR